jgi:hypothetical protein
MSPERLNLPFAAHMHGAPHSWGICMTTTILKEITVAVIGVYALLFVCDALFGIEETRFDDTYFDSASYAPRSKEFRYASDTPPAARVSDAFAQFAPGEAKQARRYSSLTTIIR